MRYRPQVVRLACRGIDLKSSVDSLAEGRYRALTNLVPTQEAALASRPGTVLVNSSPLASAGLHSLGTLRAGAATLTLAGAGASLYNLSTQASISAGFSGNPLSLVPYRLSGNSSPFMIVGDSSQMLRVSASGVPNQLGITPPASAATTAAGSPYTLSVETFNTDSGFTYEEGGGVTGITHTTVAGQVGNAIQMTATPSPTDVGFFAISIPLAINLNSFGSGNPAISDTDLISLWIQASDPNLIGEVRIMFDLQTGLGFDENFYMASVRTSDLQSALDYETTLQAAAVSASQSIRTESMLQSLPDAVEVPYDPATLLSTQLTSGTSQWTNVKIPRGSFQRIGSNTSLNWSNVQGIAVLVMTQPATGGGTVSVAVNALNVTGGYKINAGLGVAYDWRYTYQDSRTLVESNPSPIQAASLFLSPIVSPVTVTAPRSTDPQVDTLRFWRRGGTLGDNWYLVGSVANPASGSASLPDGAGDSSIASAAILSITNDQPFTTLGANGQTLYGTPLPYLFGTYNGTIIFAVGDPNNPGFLYWTNAGNAAAAAAIQNVEVSPPSDPLMNGAVWDNMPFVATMTTWYRIVPSQIGAPNQFQGLPTGAQHGLVTPWAFCLTPAGIAFVASDGIYLMAGSAEQPLAALDLWPLFNGITVEGYKPIDFTQPAKIRMAFFDSEVWFGYQDTAGTQNWWTYHIFKQDGWKHRQYPWNPAVVYSEPDQPSQALLLGGNNGNVYQQSYAEAADAGAAISYHARTGSINFNEPHSEKEFGGLIVNANTGGSSCTVEALTQYETSSIALGNISTAVLAPTPLEISDQYSPDIMLDFSGTSSAPVLLQSATLLWRPDETPVVHFESQPEGFGIGGYAHAYDGYVTLRSTAPVTLTVEVDGADIPTVTIPSTGGLREKVYVQLPLNKGKMFRESLDSTAPFRVYLEDSFINLSAWNGGSPAQMTPLGGIGAGG